MKKGSTEAVICIVDKCVEVWFGMWKSMRFLGYVFCGVDVVAMLFFIE